MPVFLWMRTAFAENTNESLLPAKLIAECWFHSLTFTYFTSFLGLKYTAGPDWWKKLNQWTSTLHPNFTDVSHLPIWFAGLQTRNQGNKLWPDNCSKKDAMWVDTLCSNKMNDRRIDLWHCFVLTGGASAKNLKKKSRQKSENGHRLWSTDRSMR